MRERLPRKPFPPLGRGAACGFPSGGLAVVGDQGYAGWDRKDILTLERHGARTIKGLRAGMASRMLALAAGVYVNS